jgi:catechol 2,3-dioxygenase-like lactoylglutathione lyase family enzyme
MAITGWDHVALPAGDPDALIDFYKKLGFETIHEAEFRAGKHPLFAIAIGGQAKLNFHGPDLWRDPDFDARGPTAQPGCGDLAFVFDGTIEEAIALIENAGAEVAYGPIDQPGGGDRGRRMGTSVYTRDPDGNLLEFMTYPCTGRYPRFGGE